jgi:hypothetical protein
LQKYAKIKQSFLIFVPAEIAKAAIQSSNSPAKKYGFAQKKYPECDSFQKGNQIENASGKRQ